MMQESSSLRKFNGWSLQESDAVQYSTPRGWNHAAKRNYLYQSSRQPHFKLVERLSQMICPPEFTRLWM
eukprot:768522-Hanusia_phi.AAC.4